MKSSWSAVLLAILAVMLYSCTDNGIESQVDGNGVPNISGVRYVNPDSSRNIDKVGPGDVVALVGTNIDATVHVYFNGVEAPFNPALLTDTTLIVTIPGDLPFGSMDPNGEEMNTIRVANDNGESVLDFPVLPPAPSVAKISNEYAYPGEQITIEGQYLYLVTSVAFPGGVEATEFNSVPDGSSMTVTVPSGATESGGIEITTAAGSTSSSPAATFREAAGMVCNFDDVNNYAGWSVAVENDPTVFPQGWGNYAHMAAEEVAGGDWSWWNGGRSINVNEVQWIDPANLVDPVASYALKFEVNVNVAMEYGTILIRNDDAWAFIARFEPWTDSGNAYQPEGWKTVTIPLTEFRAKSSDGVDGAGSSVPSLTQLLGDNASRPLGFMYVNDDEDVTQTVDLAIDNIRVVKIAE